MADPTIPSFSTRLFSDEVGIADATLPAQTNIAYRFSSGRTFAELKYDPPVPPATETGE